MNNIKLNIARRYVEGFMLSIDNNTIQDVYREFCMLLDILNKNDKHFFKILTSPQYKKNDKKILLNLILDNNKYKFSVTLSIFLKLLLKNNRLSYIYEIVFVYNKYLNKSLKQLEVVVSSAYLSKDLNENITSILKKMLKNQLKLTFLTDTSLVGGFKIKIENYLLDNTITTKLLNLKKNIISANVR